MADPKKVTRGKSLIERVMAKVPADKRASVTALLEVEDVLEEIGADGLRQDEFSRAMTEAQNKEKNAVDWKVNLDGWWKTKQEEFNATLVENTLLKEKLEAGNPNPNPAPAAGTSTAVDLTGYVKKEDVDRTIAARVAEAAQGVVPLVSVVNRLSMQHFKDFGEILDVDALIEHSRKTQTPIDKGAYETFAKDKLDEKKKKEDEAVIAAAEKRGEERARAAYGSAQPYPLTTAEPTTLDGLDKTKQHGGVDAAVTLFNKLVSGAA